VHERRKALHCRTTQGLASRREGGRPREGGRARGAHLQAASACRRRPRAAPRHPADAPTRPRAQRPARRQASGVGGRRRRRAPCGAGGRRAPRIAEVIHQVIHRRGDTSLPGGGRREGGGGEGGGGEGGRGGKHGGGDPHGRRAWARGAPCGRQTCIKSASNWATRAALRASAAPVPCRRRPRVVGAKVYVGWCQGAPGVMRRRASPRDTGLLRAALALAGCIHASHKGKGGAIGAVVAWRPADGAPRPSTPY
jgi:hypothetical protein